MAAPRKTEKTEQATTGKGATGKGATGKATTGNAATGKAPSAAPPVGDVRLELLTRDPRHTTTLDGAWWPRSGDLVTELPPLVAELRRRGHRATRAAYHPQLWDDAPRVMQADGRTVHIGWFRSIDPHLLSLTGSGGQRLELLVVPPDTTEATASRAMALASTGRNRATPTAVLAAAAEPAAR